MTGNVYFQETTSHWTTATLTVENAHPSFPTSLWLTVGGDVTIDNGHLQYRFPDGDPDALSIGGNLTLTNAALSLHAGATNGMSDGAVGGLLDLTDKTLSVPTNCTIYLHSHPTDGGGMKIVAHGVQIDTGGAISADAQGYYDGGYISAPGRGYTLLNGPGAGGGTLGQKWQRGGGYGGAGGRGHSGTSGGGTYGSPYGPMQPGSGTANSYGGGLVHIEADTVTLDGTITANGRNGDAAGSGGGIHVDCRKFFGNGKIFANGGNGGNYGGGGGGGRIAIWTWISKGYADQIKAGTVPSRVDVSTNTLPTTFTAAFTNAVSVKGGAGGGSAAQPGEPGTFRWLDATPRGSLFMIR
jgi:hypothetical protein